MSSSIFQSFWMGGFECSTHRLPRRKAMGSFAGLRLDLIVSTRHEEFALQDYARLQEAGMQTARDGVRWHLIEKSPSRYDFSTLVPMLRAARETQTQVIWDLLHIFVTPVNEISFVSWGGGDAGFARCYAKCTSDIENRSS